MPNREVKRNKKKDKDKRNHELRGKYSAKHVRATTLENKLKKPTKLKKKSKNGHGS
jgi:hypothetical protein